MARIFSQGLGSALSQANATIGRRNLPVRSRFTPCSAAFLTPLNPRRTESPVHAPVAGLSLATFRFPTFWLSRRRLGSCDLTFSLVYSLRWFYRLGRR